MPSIKFNGQAINYILRLDKRRKTIQIKVVSAADLEIVSPAKLSNIEITEILATKKRWLANRFGKFAQLAASPINQHLVSGTQLLYQGKPYTLQILLGSNKPEIELTTSEIIVRQPPDGSGTNLSFLTKGIIKAWLIDQAGKLFFEKTRHWATVIGVHPARITIKDQKTRWGSCSSLGNINYNWRIIMAPPPVADYLIIHELCHMLVPNHSAKFWQQVSLFSPDYQPCRKWLTENSQLLSRIF